MKYCVLFSPVNYAGLENPKASTLKEVCNVLEESTARRESKARQSENSHHITKQQPQPQPQAFYAGSI